MNERPTKPPRRLYETVTKEIARQILGGQYEIGDRLPAERVLAEQFNVSRPTIREAMIALEVDGLVEVCTGSGVYVRALQRRGKAAPMDIGPFELLETRALVEGEACALAATHIKPDQIEELEQLLGEMEAENTRGDVVMSEDADHRFHMAIAEATQNSGMVHVVGSLWEARHRSLQTIKFLEKARVEGVKPRIDEHRAIVDALKTGDANAARAAMRTHLHGVADMLFAATEAEAVEKARVEAAENRKKYRVIGME
ncbi:FadR/GntR family transcriptional regulator [Parasphingorhabdus litoris]|uniref:FadR/GntR family transcriptional regulator n=1 Tax=Parasphingorhabdus litoris TaxID=394733 RepID=A0ABN1AU13_9SPHN|nr:FadR/GntR family transcriptional regulator [Parasphingorhabdus litoris]